MNISNFDKSSRMTESIPLIEERYRKRSSVYSQDCIFVVIGATGRLGALITEILVGKGIRVIAVVKDSKKLFAKLQEHILNRLEKFVEIDFSLDSDERRSKWEVEDVHEYVIINALEFRHKYESYNKVLKSHFNLIKDIKESKQSIKRFIYISSNLANYPFCFRSFLINLRYGLLLQYRQQCENLVKSSGLNYLIISPNKIFNQTEIGKLNDIYLTQDECMGPGYEGIGSFTLSRLIVDAAFDKWIPDFCSFKCSASNVTKEYQYVRGSFKLHSDKDDKKCSPVSRFSHFGVFYLYNFILLGLISGGTLSLFKFIKGRSIGKE